MMHENPANPRVPRGYVEWNEKNKKKVQLRVRQIKKQRNNREKQRRLSTTSTSKENSERKTKSKSEHLSEYFKKRRKSTKGKPKEESTAATPFDDISVFLQNLKTSSPFVFYMTATTITLLLFWLFLVLPLQKLDFISATMHCVFFCTCCVVVYFF